MRRYQTNRLRGKEAQRQKRGSLSREKAEEGEREGEEGRGVQSIPQMRGTITEPN